MTEEESKLCAELWIEFEPGLRKICATRMNGYTGEMDDVISDVYLALCKQVATKEVPHNIKGWLYSTLNNIINKYFKAKYKAAENTVPINADQIELPYKQDFVDVVIDNDCIEQLNELIAKLNKIDQTIIKYTYMDKHTMKEIGKMLGMTEAAVKQRRYRICNILRDALYKKINL